MKFYSSNSAFTDAMKSYVENNEKQHLQKYLKIFGSPEGTCKFKVETDGVFKVELEYEKLNLRASRLGSDFYEAADEAVDRILVQLKKMKEKKENKTIRVVGVNELDDVKSPFDRTKLAYLVEMTDERAIEEMEQLDHTFFVYKDVYAGESDVVSVAYKRSDGTYGVIRFR